MKTPKKQEKKVVTEPETKTVLLTLKGERVKFRGYIDEFVAGQVLAFISDQKRLRIIKK